MQPEPTPSADVIALLRPGVGPMPAGDVTFVFFDIEGSTRLLREFGDDYASLLATHQALVARSMRDHDGVLVSAPGDSLFFACPDAVGAVAGTVAAQRAMAAHPWPVGGAIRVRAGLHTGAAQPFGSDYVAMAVHQAARISAATHGGQIVCSATTASLAGTLPDGVTPVKLGRFRLKDFDEPVALVEISYDNRTFPPLRTTPESVRRIPVPRTSFVGRAREFSDVRARLSEAPLTTLCGPGGAGKTRLALEVASSLAAEDDVAVIELAALGTGEQVVPALAAALEVDQAEGRPLLDMVGEILADRSMVLVLDNCEHLIDAAADVVSRLVTVAPGLRVLATSREPLQLPEETVYRLAPLDVPPEGATLDEVVRHTGARLLLDRVHSQDPSFTVTEGDAPALRALVAALDGLPLAVELVAARVATDGLASVVSSLQDEDLLLGGRGRPERHRSMEAALRWSDGLLLETERACWHRLSVFVGSFSVEAAGAVAEAPRIAPLLNALVNKSLVQRLEADTRRYRLHQRMREFGLARLREAGLEEAVRDRHAEWAQDVARVVGDDFRFERDDCVAAWEYAWRTGRAVRFSVLGACLGEYDMTRGHRRSEALARLAEVESLDASPETAEAFAVAALAWHEDEPERAVRLAEAALASSDEPVVVAPAWRAKALAQVMLYDIAGAQASLDQVAAADWYGSDARTQTVVEGTAAMVCELGGDLDGALRHARAFLDLAVSSGSVINTGRAHGMIAWLSRRNGAPEAEVRREIELARKAAERADDHGGLVALLTLEAELADVLRARVLIREALARMVDLEYTVHLLEADGLAHALTAARALRPLAALLGVAQALYDTLPTGSVAHFARILDRITAQVAELEDRDELVQQGRAAAEDAAPLLLRLL
jgi:predicted ATPase/class 3 adenylate cyclase